MFGLQEDLRRRLAKSGTGWLVMLDSRDRGTDSDEDDVKGKCQEASESDDECREQMCEE